jgi:hypothetical protein
VTTSHQEVTGGGADRSGAHAPPAPDRRSGPAPGPGTGRRPWWRRPWMLPLAAVAGWFLWITLPKYLTFDPGKTPIRLNPRFHLHYPLLLAHVLFGTVALLCACLSVWPWLRVRHPAAHRRVGRVYVFGGVLPTALLALSIMPFSQAPAGHTVAATLWLTTTFIGWRMSRLDREAEHRRWMTYSFALTLQIVWGRVMFAVLPRIPAVNMADPHTLGLIFETASWIGIFINLLAAQIFLEVTARRSAARATAP